MPDTPVAPSDGGRYLGDMESCVAVLGQISRTTSASLERIERRLDMLAASQQADLRWLLGITLGGFGVMLGGYCALLGVMAHGFHWL
jgi:hypothetical protein